MKIEPKDWRTFKQGDVTKGQIEATLTIKFKFRPAGWAGNDKMVLHPIETILNLIHSIFKYTNILMGDESVTYEARWKRPNDKTTTPIDIEYN